MATSFGSSGCSNPGGLAGQNQRRSASAVTVTKPTRVTIQPSGAFTAGGWRLLWPSEESLVDRGFI
jgi:hypothetical protein